MADILGSRQEGQEASRAMETQIPAERRDRRPPFRALELAVVGTDIREDSCRYSVFIIAVGRHLRRAGAPAFSPCPLRVPS